MNRAFTHAWPMPPGLAEDMAYGWIPNSFIRSNTGPDARRRDSRNVYWNRVKCVNSSTSSNCNSAPCHFNTSSSN